eukprot:CCRYP_014696-RA/>CCRYP_014696-RA protein AED:0.40 eAED:0.26 QI:0/0/0/1/0/0/3/0/506
MPSLAAPSPQHDIYIKTYDTRDTVYSDQTVKFPHTSSRGNRYQMILYHTDSNSIWVKPTKNRTEGELILARTKALSRMRACGLTPRHQVLNNKASAACKQAILDSGLTYQLVPPNDHRRNVAKKAIQTWKDHFIAILSCTLDKFLLHLWCQLIPHMDRQLNLLHQSNSNSKISAYAHLYGPHDYNSVPFVPLGMEAPVHDKPNRHKTYAQHCSKGWVIGTSTEHYSCWMIWSTTTHTTCIAATVFFKHKYLTNPSISPTNALITAAANLAHVMQHPKHSTGQKTAGPTVTATTFQQDHQATADHSCTTRTSRPPRPTSKGADTAMPLPTLPVVSNDEDSDDKPEPPPRVRTHCAVPLVSNPQPTSTTPALNTHSLVRSLTYEAMLHICPHITMESLPPKPHNDVTQPTCSMQYSMTRLVPGIVKGTNTIVFIHKTNVPQGRWKDVTYGCIVANFCPENDDPYCIHLTVDGNCINFPGDCGTSTADMITVKILLNSVISKKCQVHDH